MLKNTFIRNVVIVASGAAGAQGVALCFAPFLTRLYGPEAFGVFGVFSAMVGILAPLSALAYPLAIVLPRSDGGARALTRLSLMIALAVSVVVVLALGWFHPVVVDYFNLQSVAPLLWLLPFSLFLAASLTILTQWVIRRERFALNARTAMIHALAVNSAKLGFGWFHPLAATLIILTFCGGFLHALLLALGLRKKTNTPDNCSPESNDSSSTAMGVARRYKDFPRYKAPQTLLYTMADQLPLIILAAVSGPAVAGFFALSQKILLLPVGLVAESLRQVFHPRLAKAAHHSEPMTPLLLKATTGLLAVGFIPFGVIIAIGPMLFGLVFGADWQMAGEYARWLSLALFCYFCGRPAMSAIIVLEKQKALLIYEVLSSTAKLAGLIIGLWWLGSALGGIILYSLVSVVFGICLILLVHRYAREADDRHESLSA